jgi:hypothetical protein
MEQPTISNKIEVEIRSDEVLLKFEYNIEADQFREWWEQEGWNNFLAWQTDTDEKPAQQ